MQTWLVERGGEFLGKVGIIALFGVFATLKAIAIWKLLGSWEQTTDKYLDLAGHIAALAFITLVLGTTLLRFRPNQTSEGWEPRFSALAGSFLSLSLVALPPADLDPVWRIISIVLVLVGWVLSIYVLAWLGRSFSIVPQARKLITSGPYSVVRHPLYVSEEIVLIGIALMIISPIVVLVVIVQWMFQLRRMSNEERVLRSSFPEYDAYAARTPKVIPRLLYHRSLSNRGG